VLTKSRHYSTTFAALRQRRRYWAQQRLREAGIEPVPLAWAVEGFGVLPQHAAQQVVDEGLGPNPPPPPRM
jgi:hypothetical protein